MLQSTIQLFFVWTPDAGHVEQMDIIIRFVDVTSKSESEIAVIFIKAHILSFVLLKETTGERMAETVLRQLEDMGSSIKNLRGQG